MQLPRAGRPIDEVIAELDARRAGDVRWEQGRAFGLVYDGGASVQAVAEQAASRFLHANALNTAAFPSLASIQHDVVAWTAALLHGGPEVAGFLTSGGTESIECAVLAARQRAKAERGIEAGTIVVAESAHAAFHKSAHLFAMPIVTVPVTDDWTVDLDAMADAIDDRTALVVGSAPQYPQGVVDQIPEIAQMAAAVGAHCHVDACMGGFVLPFAEMLGRPIPAWDFGVDGVDSISADVHKLGYAPKGASVILYANKHLRRYQTWVFDGWLGGMYGSPNLQGTRSGLPMAAAWAVIEHLGVDGYVELTRNALHAADRMREAIAATDGIRSLGEGGLHIVALASDPTGDDPIDVFALGDALAQRGWYHDRQGPPDSLHSTVSNSNTQSIAEWIDDLAVCAAEVRGRRTDDRSTSYSTVD